jgi:hypothetical protein
MLFAHCWSAGNSGWGTHVNTWKMSCLSAVPCTSKKMFRCKSRRFIFDRHAKNDDDHRAIISNRHEVHHNVRTLITF